MELQDISVALLITTVVFFVTSVFARRIENKGAKIHLVTKALGAAVLSLAAVYFYKRYTA